MLARLGSNSRGLLRRVLGLGLLPWVLGCFLVVHPLYAGQAEPVFDDPVLGKRLTALTQELRCLVCQGQSLAESDSDFAVSLKREIYLMLKRGDSDQEIIDFLVARYGDFILFRPPVKGTTALLWFGPALLLVIAVTVLAVTVRRRRKLPDQKLSQDEIKRAEALLGDDLKEGRP